MAAHLTKCQVALISQYRPVDKLHIQQIHPSPQTVSQALLLLEAAEISALKPAQIHKSLNKQEANMIKISSQSHATFSSVMKKLAIVGFFGVLVFFGWVAAQSHLEAKDILSEKQVVEAILNLDEVTEKRRKRRTSYTYHFSYVFEVNGNNYGSSFSTSESNAEKFIDQPSLPVAYKSSDPSVHDRLSVIEKNASLFGVIKRMLIALPLIALMVGLVYLLITAKLVTARDA